jgi:sugar phosphate isomerase/epimerase
VLPTRRDIFKLALATPALNAAGRLGPDRLGANTAIKGMGLLEAIATLREIGFPVIEIQAMGVPGPVSGRFPGFEFDRISTGEKRAIRTALRGVSHVTTHLPYAGLHFFDAREEGAAASRERLKVAMEGAAFFGSELAVAHTTAPVGLTVEQAWPLMIRTFRAWGDAAAKAKFRLAIETGTGGIDNGPDFVRLIKEIDHEWVGCTLDVGHQIHYKEFVKRVPMEQRSTAAGIRVYNDVTLAIVDGLGPKLFHLHVHDIDPRGFHEHVPVGTGVIDYPRLFGKLRRMNYGGLLVLEIAAPDMRASLRDSKRRLEAFLS